MTRPYADIRRAAVAFLDRPDAFVVPAYGRGIAGRIDAIARCHEAGTRPETIVLIRGRVRFTPAGGAAPFPSALAYVGPRGEAFARTFSGLGIVIQRIAG